LKNRLRVIRAERKISQEYLASKAKITRASLSRIENELQEPSVSTIKKIASALNLNISDIFLL
jgi:DNA-binding XRE family transcriptional regulator